MSLEHLDMAIAFAVVMLAVSLLVTIFVQVVSALFGLRGTNLVWGVEQLLLTVHPELGDRAKTIARTVLQHPLISDSAISRMAWLRAVPLVGRVVGRMQFANAIRVQELVGVMDVMAGSATPSMDAKATLQQQMAAIVGNARQKLDREMQAVASQASAVASTLRRDAAASAGPAAAGLPGGTATGTVDIDELLDRIPAVAQLKLAKDDLQGWFDTAMDRVSQRFTLHARLWTVAFSIVIAFAMHLDTFRLLAQLASNPDARAQIASAAGALQQVAAARLNPPPAAGGTAPGSAGPHPPQLYRQVMTQALDAARIKADVPASFSDRQAAVDWLRTALAAQGQAPDAIEAVVADYQSKVDAGLGSELDRLADQALTVRGVMNDTSFQLVPNPYHSWDISPWWPSRDFRHPANLHFWGILFSAGLLSLGAPFWYNALKNLSALKPVVASKAEGERQALA